VGRGPDLSPVRRPVTDPPHRDDQVRRRHHPR
jgi:hypothetical protein